MLQSLMARLRGANDDEKGFTLIELLVVVLIIGILAAIALPTFLGQQKKGQDASAKSDARNAVTQIESCFTDSGSTSPTTDYSACVGTGHDYPGKPASVTTSVPTGGALYQVDAKSKSNITFTIIKNADGTYSRSCDNPGVGGCKDAGGGNGDW